MTRSDTPVTSTIELRQLRAFALELLAYSVCELFPGVLLGRGHFTSAGFSYEFVFNQIPNEEMLHIIEEKLRKNFKEISSFETRDMMRENAAMLFEHLEQPLKADEILNQSSNVVSLIKIGEFQDLKPHSLKEPCLGVPKLLHLKSFSKNELTITRIEGTVFPDLQQLKTYVKSLKGIEKKNPIELGKKLGLFELFEEGFFLYPRGEILKQLIVAHVDAMVEEAGYAQISSNLSSNFEKLKPFYRFSEGFANWYSKASSSSENALNESLFELEAASFLKIQQLEGEKTLLDKCISSLQFIEKTIKIFDLNLKWVLCVPNRKEGGSKDRKKEVELLAAAIKASSLCCEEDSELLSSISPMLELIVSDERGVEWKIAALSVSGKTVNLQFGPIEGLMALVIEKTSGQLPAWILPEWVRILPVERGSIAYAKTVQAACRKQKIRTGMDLLGVQAEGSKSLAERLHLAIQHKVPYILIVGESEESKGKVALRRLGSEKSKLIELEEFLALISEQDMNKRVNT